MKCTEARVDPRINAQTRRLPSFPGMFPVDVHNLIIGSHHKSSLHRADCLKIVVLESGECTYRVEDNTYAVAKSDIISVENCLRHSFEPLVAPEPGARAIVLSFAPESVHCETPLLDDLQYLMPFAEENASISSVIFAQESLAREIVALIQRVREKLLICSELSRLAIRTYLKTILMLVLTYYSETGTLKNIFDSRKQAMNRLAQVFEHLKNHYDEPFRIKDAARLCAVSSCSFMHLFKKVTGQSFISYLNHFRVAKAQVLLVTTNRSISAISLDTGLCTHSYFGTIFRKVTGMAPLAYRLRYKASTDSSNVAQIAVNPWTSGKITQLQRLATSAEQGMHRQPHRIGQGNAPGRAVSA